MILTSDLKISDGIQVMATQERGADKTRLELIITKAHNTPLIRFNDIEVITLNASGKVISIRQEIPQLEYFLEVGTVGVTASGSYITTAPIFEPIAKLKLVINRETHELSFPTKK